MEKVKKYQKLNILSNSRIFINLYSILVDILLKKPKKIVFLILVRYNTYSF